MSDDLPASRWALISSRPLWWLVLAGAIAGGILAGLLATVMVLPFPSSTKDFIEALTGLVPLGVVGGALFALFVASLAKKRLSTTLYALVLGANLIWTFGAYVIVHGGTCTGTGMGGNQVLLVCQEYAMWLVFGINVAICCIALGLVHLLKLGSGFRAVTLAILTASIFFLSCALWNTPLFMTRVR